MDSEKISNTSGTSNSNSDNVEKKSFANWCRSVRKSLRMLTPCLLVTLCTAGIGSPFLIGYNTGVLNSPQLVVTKWMRQVRCSGLSNRNDADNENKTLSLWCRELNRTEEEHATTDNTMLGVMWFSLNVLFSTGGLVGALVSQYVVKLGGRKGALLLNNSTAITGALLQGFAYVANSFVMLAVGRTVVGINAGISTAVAPVYFMDMVPDELSGALGALQRLFDVTGTLVAQILGLPTLLGDATTWPYLLGFGVVPAALQLAVLPFAPRDPKYLAEVKDDELGAEKDQRSSVGSQPGFEPEPDSAVLKQDAPKILQRVISAALGRLRGTARDPEEVKDLRKEHAKSKHEVSVAFGDLFRDRSLRTVTTVGLILISSRQLTGINAAYFFSTDIFKAAGLQGVNALYATIGVGVTLVVATLLTACLVEKTGRRGLMLFGLAGVCLTTSVLAAFIVIYEKNNGTAENVHQIDSDGSSKTHWSSLASMVVFFVFLIVYSVGPGTIPSFMITEMFTQKARSAANSGVLGMHWLCGTIVAAVFPLLKAAVHGYAFVLFAGLTAFYFLFVLLKVPETKGKETDDIQAEIIAKNQCLLCKPAQSVKSVKDCFSLCWKLS